MQAPLFHHSCQWMADDGTGTAPMEMRLHGAIRFGPDFAPPDAIRTVVVNFS